MNNLKKSNLYNSAPAKSPIDNGPGILSTNFNYDDNQANNNFMDLINKAVVNNANTVTDGIWSQMTETNVPWEPSVTLSKVEHWYLEKIEIAADLLAGQVITSAEFFKLKMLLKSKDPEVRKLGEIFLNEKTKL
jgi:hypothetical protein